MTLTTTRGIARERLLREALATSESGMDPVEEAVRKLTAAGAPAALQLAVLRALDREGPLTSAEVPRRWPVTRQHIRDALRDLALGGLVELTMATGACRSYRLTKVGRRCLEEIDWAAAAGSELSGRGVGT